MISRTCNEIVASILESANGGATSLKMMYSSYIGHTQLRKYLKLLMGNDMLEYEPETSIFRTSEKGFKFLKIHKQFEEAFSWLCYDDTRIIHQMTIRVSNTNK